MPTKKTFLLFSTLFVLLSSTLLSSVYASAIMWSKTYGGSDDETATSLVKTSDGGYAITGATHSFGAKTHTNFWLVKTDAHGNIEWNKTYGTDRWNHPYDMIATSDGGYALAGVNGFFWRCIKISSNGTEEWNRIFDPEDVHAGPYSIVETSDGDFALAGYKWPGNTGTVDFFVVKISSSGHVMWNKTYDSGENDYAYSMVRASDGGLVIVGGTLPFGASTSNLLLVKITVSGNMRWQRIYKEARTNWANHRELISTSDGGFAIATGGVLIKTDSSGSKEWNHTYNGSISSLVQVSDGGYALAGHVSSKESNSDCWLAKIDANGTIEWTQTYGGQKSDSFSSVVETSDGGFAIAGTTNSFGAGGTDFLLIKTNEYGIIAEFSLNMILSIIVSLSLIVLLARYKLSKKC